MWPEVQSRFEPSYFQTCQRYVTGRNNERNRLISLYLELQSNQGMTIEDTIFWNVTPCRLVAVYWRLGRMSANSLTAA
jgi:hypothetical protein